MKKIIPVSWCLAAMALLVIAFYSCSKNDAYWASPSSRAKGLSVADAKSWFSGEYSSEISDIGSTGKSRLVSYARGVFAGVPDWTYHQNYRNNPNGLMIPLDFPDTSTKFRGFRDVIVLRNNVKKTFNAYVQLEIFNKSYLKSQIKKLGNLPDIRSYSDPATFSGEVLLYSIRNEFIRGAVYKDGKVTARIFPKNGISGMINSFSNRLNAKETYVRFDGGANLEQMKKDNASSKVALPSRAAETSYEETVPRTQVMSTSGDTDDTDTDDTDTDDSSLWTDTNLEEVVVISTPDTDDSDDTDWWDSDDSSYDDSRPTTTDPTPSNPYAGGGGGSNQSESMQTITDSLSNFTCAQNVLNSILNSNNKIANLINSTFSKNSQFNITFVSRTGSQLATLLNSSGNGSTIDGITLSTTNTTNNTFNATIAINEDILNYASKEYILATMIHESLHAFLNSEKSRLGATAFAQQYPSVEALYSYNSNNGTIDVYHFLSGTNNHQQFNAYMGNMTSMLENYNPNLSSNVIDALIRSGVIQPSDLTQATKNLNLNERDTRNNNYQGTKCP